MLSRTPRAVMRHLPTRRLTLPPSKLGHFHDSRIFTRSRRVQFRSPLIQIALFSSRVQSTREGPDPYNYTDGRWLRHDALHRQARMIQFDFDSLCQKVVTLCPGASSISSYEKKEGDNNRVFIFHTDNGKRVVARLPFSVAGPPRYRTSSEVATIKYLQQTTSIPIPEILDWSDDASNPIGTEYIIMEHASGVPLHEKWPTMDVDEQSEFVSKMFFGLRDLGKLEFPAYGSLYFANTPYVTATELPSNPTYCIGPHCGSAYWDCNPREPRYYHTVNPNRGPWPNLSTYCDSLIDLGISRVPPSHLITKHPHWQEFHGSTTEHYDLLEQGRALLKAMTRHPSIQESAKPSLFHPCLHTDNIFVSEDTPTTVTAIIDWQACSIEPAFHYADISPDFAQPRPHVQPERELSFKRDECGIRFDLGLIVFFGPMFKARRMDTAYLDPFRYCHRTWKDGAIRFRNEIVQTARRWQELGLDGSCPVALPSDAEYAKHMEEHETFQEIQEWKESKERALNRVEDGWVPAESYEKMQALHLELLDWSVQHMFEGEGIDWDTQVQNYVFLKEVWPFDLPAGYKEELRRG